MAINQGWLVCFGGFVMHLGLGTIYTWGNMTTYATSFLRKYDSEVTFSKNLITFALMCIGQAFTMWPSGVLQRKIGPRITAIMGVLLTAGGVALSSLSTSLLAFEMTYGLMFGFGIGLAYTCPMVCGFHHLPKYKGLVNGIITGGFGLGAFIFDFVMTQLINPDNVSPCAYNKTSCPWGDPHDLDSKYFNPHGPVCKRVPGVLLILASIYLALGLFGSIFFVNPKRKEDEFAEDEKKLLPDSEAINASSSLGKQSVDVSPFGLMTSYEGWLVWTMFILTATGGVFVFGSYKTYAQRFAYGNDRFLSITGSAISVCNFLGRVTQGRLADILGFKKVLLVMAFTQGGMLLSLTYVSKNEYLFVAWVCLVAFLYGGNFALYPTGVMELFGKTHAGSNYGLIFTGFGVAGVLAALLKGPLEAAVHGFRGLTFLMGGAAILGGIFTIGVRSRKR
eukprot:m.73788 g.73788  ORF g.73788 m.73788 type:complete len:449 (+) comp12434_c0_seq1:171-1517(+)